MDDPRLHNANQIVDNVYFRVNKIISTYPHNDRQKIYDITNEVNWIFRQMEKEKYFDLEKFKNEIKQWIDNLEKIEEEIQKIKNKK
jgi:hypothetical protein